MPRKTFRVAVAAESIDFDLSGSQSTQNFHCRDRMAAGKLMRFAELFSAIEEESGKDEKTGKQAANAIPAIRDFFNAALMPEGRDRFWKMIDNDDEGIPLDTLVEIAGWLAEVYSGDRPTGAPSRCLLQSDRALDGEPGHRGEADLGGPRQGPGPVRQGRAGLPADQGGRGHQRRAAAPAGHVTAARSNL
jgi:hypothetical protein